MAFQLEKKILECITYNKDKWDFHVVYLYALGCVAVKNSLKIIVTALGCEL